MKNKPLEISLEDLHFYKMETLGTQVLVPKQVIEYTNNSLKHSNERDYTKLTWESHELQADDGKNSFFYAPFPIRRIRNSRELKMLGFKEGKSLEEYMEKIEKTPSPHIKVLDSPCDPNGAIGIPYYRHGLINLCLAHYDEKLGTEQQEKIDFTKKAIKDLMIVYSALCCYTKELIRDDSMRGLYEQTLSAIDELSDNVEPKYDETIKELIAYFRKHFNDEGIWANKENDSKRYFPMSEDSDIPTC